MSGLRGGCPSPLLMSPILTGYNGLKMTLTLERMIYEPESFGAHMSVVTLT